MLIVEYYLNNFMNIQVIIPAHIDSIRLKRKVLIDIKGLPMIEHVRRRVLLSTKINKVYVATGDIEIKKIVESYGGNVILTKKIHQNGTNRAIEAIENLDCSHIVLVQGDEPLLLPENIDLMVENIISNKKINVWNAISPLKVDKELDEQTFVKCFVNKNDEIIFCFRRNPTYLKLKDIKNSVFKIQGLFAFRKNFLKNLNKMKISKYQNSVSIEQMRIIDSGFFIKAVKLSQSLPSVNNFKELEIVKRILSDDKNQKLLLKKILN